MTTPCGKNFAKIFQSNILCVLFCTILYFQFEQKKKSFFSFSKILLRGFLVEFYTQCDTEWGKNWEKHKILVYKCEGDTQKIIPMIFSSDVLSRASSHHLCERRKKGEKRV